MIYNVLSISAIQQSGPVRCTIYILFSHVTIHHVPSQVTRCIPLCRTAGPHCLPTPNAIVCIYLPQTPSLSLFLPLPLGNHKSVLHVHEFVSFLQIGSFVPMLVSRYKWYQPHLILYLDFVLSMWEVGMSASLWYHRPLCRERMCHCSHFFMWLYVLLSIVLVKKVVRYFLSVLYLSHALGICILNLMCSENLLYLWDFKWHFLKDCGMGMSSCLCVQCCCLFLFYFSLFQ